MYTTYIESVLSLLMCLIRYNALQPHKPVNPEVCDGEANCQDGEDKPICGGVTDCLDVTDELLSLATTTCF